MALRFPLESSRCIVPSRCVIRSSGPRCQRSPEALGVGRALDHFCDSSGLSVSALVAHLGALPGFLATGPRLARVCAVSSGVCQLTPSGSRLGLTPSLRAWPNRGTSLCSMFLLYGVLLAYHAKVLCFNLKAGSSLPALLEVSREGPLGPRV